MLLRLLLIFLSLFSLRNNALSPNSYHFGDDLKNSEHIKEHLSEQVNVDKMDFGDEAMRFYYFSLYDSNSDGLIDGLDLVRAIDHNAQHHDEQAPIKNEAELEVEVDAILNEVDKDLDGYVNWVEFNDYVNYAMKI